MKNLKSSCGYIRRIHVLFLIMSCMVVSACGAREAELRWIEPVRLASGEEVKVNRHVVVIHQRAWGGGFSSAPVYKRSSIELLDDGSNIPAWDAPLVPLVIDKDPENGEWIIVASIDGCSLWERNGRPRPPYWAFRLRAGEWYRDAIPQSFANRVPNLLVEYSVSDTSQQLERDIGERKRVQLVTPKRAPIYRSINPAYEKKCNREPSDPIGINELDLKNFRSIQ